MRYVGSAVIIVLLDLLILDLWDGGMLKGPQRLTFWGVTCITSVCLVVLFSRIDGVRTRTLGLAAAGAMAGYLGGVVGYILSGLIHGDVPRALRIIPAEFLAFSLLYPVAMLTWLPGTVAALWLRLDAAGRSRDGRVP